MVDWTRERIAWAAGLIEGEGCITRQVTTKRSTEYSYWQLKVTSTDRDALERLGVAYGVAYGVSAANDEEADMGSDQPDIALPMTPRIQRDIRMYAAKMSVVPASDGAPVARPTRGKP